MAKTLASLIQRLRALVLPLLAIALLMGASPRAAGQSLRGFQMSTGSTASAITDLQYLNGLGATMVRFPVYFSFEPSVDVWIQRADAVLAEAARRNMTVVVTFHHPTVGVWGSSIANEADFRARWRRFAQGLKSRRNAWFNLANEPRGSYNGRSWRDIAQTVGTDIRKIDGSRKIVVAVPSTRLSGLRSFSPPKLSNIVVEAHAYDWAPEQGTSISPYPDRSINWTKSDIAARLQWAVDFKKQTGITVYIGEVAVCSVENGQANPYAAAFLRDFTAECKKKALPLTLHAFREAGVWNYEANPSAWAVIVAWLRK